MSVEDHPKFDAWSKALIELRQATDVYNEAVARPVRPSWVSHAKRLMEMAQQRYDRISAELDDA